MQNISLKQMALAAPDWEMRLRILLGRGIFDRRSYQAAMSKVQSHHTALDVGAHVGSWTIALSRQFQQVVSVEPDKINRSYLNRNLANQQIGNVTVLPCALVNAAPDLKREFFIRSSSATRNSGMSHLIPAEHKTSCDEQVQAARLDDLMAQPEFRDSQIDFVKIDTEGFELDVLRGGDATLRAHKPVLLVEINRWCGRYGVKPEEVKAHIEKIGYKQTGQVRNDHIYQTVKP